MGQIQLTTALIMIGLFSLAIIGFAVNFAQDNNAAVDISDDPELTGLYTVNTVNLTDFSVDSQDTYASIVNASIEAGSQTTQSGGQFAITPSNSLGAVKNIIRVGYTKIFGNGAGFGIFLTSFFAILVFRIGLYIWKTWGGRDPD